MALEPIDPRDVVLRLARAMTWVREIGANRGQSVEAILQSVHLPAGSPWCAAFISWVGHTPLGSQWPLPMVGGCSTLGELAEARGILRSEPAPAAIFLLYSDARKRFNHTGFIVFQAPSPPGPALWKTIEGNTSPDGSPEGTGVFERTRSFRPADRFIWWWS